MYGPNNLMIDMLDIVKIVQRLRAQRLELRATLVATAALAQSKCDANDALGQTILRQAYKALETTEQEP